MRLLLTLITAFGMCLTSFGATITWPARTNGPNVFFSSNTFLLPTLTFGLTVTNSAANTCDVRISGNAGTGGLTALLQSTPSGLLLSGDTGLGNSIQINGLGVLSGNGSGLTDLTLPDPMTLNQLNVGTLILTNSIAGTNITGATTITNGLAGLSSPTFTGIVTAEVDSPTNTWTVNSSFGLGTNAVITSGAATLGITGVANLPTTTERYGQLVITATGDVVFTNLASIHVNDFLTSRTITNGNCAVVAVDVVPGIVTNMAIVQFK